MDEESTEVQELLTPEEPITPDNGGQESGTEVDDVEQLKATNQKLYARLKKAEAEAKELKASAGQAPKETPQPTNPSSSDDPRFERLELKTDGYTADEVDFIMQNGGRAALENSFVKEAIASARRKAKSLDATPSDTAKSKVYQNYTQDQIQNMSVEDLEKILPRAD